jgi:serine hydrolase
VRRVLIVHGWTNVRPDGHWQRRLATELRRSGDCVVYPQLPDTDQPVLERWLEVLRVERALLDEVGTGETVVVAHSLGCILWLAACARRAVEPPVDRVLLVAPPDPALLGEIPTFQLDPSDPRVVEGLRAGAASTLLLGGDADPWTPAGLQATFGDPLGLVARILPGASHLALSEGWGPWQGVIDWVRDPAADLARR